MATETMNLFQKLAKIRKQLEVIQKDSDGYGYKYVSEAEILSKLSVWMDKMGLLLIPEVEHGSCSAWIEEFNTSKLDKKTHELVEERKYEAVVKGNMKFTWIDIDNPADRLEVPWFFTGQQADASQAFGSGLTYCTRYFLLKFFNIATVEDDPDNWRSKQKSAEKEEDLLLAKEITAQIDEVAKKYVTESADFEKAKEELTKLSKKYIKSGNYLKIEEPKLAKKMLDDVKKLAGNKEE